jgi:hypothetical protein
MVTGVRRADGSGAGPAAIAVALLAAHSSQRGCHQQARSARAMASSEPEPVARGTPVNLLAASVATL